MLDRGSNAAKMPIIDDASAIAIKYDINSVAAPSTTTNAAALATIATTQLWVIKIFDQIYEIARISGPTRYTHACAYVFECSVISISHSI